MGTSREKTNKSHLYLFFKERKKDINIYIQVYNIT